MDFELGDWRRAALLAARLLIGALFLAGAVQKALDPEPARMLLAEWGLPGEMVWPALGLNAVMALAFFSGRHVQTFAIVAAAYCAATSVFHFKPADPWQMSIFVKNWALAGGSLALAVAWSTRP